MTMTSCFRLEKSSVLAPRIASTWIHWNGYSASQGVPGLLRRRAHFAALLNWKDIIRNGCFNVVGAQRTGNKCCSASGWSVELQHVQGGFHHRGRRSHTAPLHAFSGSLGALTSDDDDDDAEPLEVTRVRSRPKSVVDLDELSPSTKERIAQFVKDDYDLTSTSYTGESESDDEGSLSSNGKPNDSAIEGASSGKELGYQVLEIDRTGRVRTRDISRRQLLRSTGLRPRDVRRIDPLLWVTNSLPAILVRNQAILLNLGSLRAIASPEHCLVFDHTSVGASAFLEVFTARLAASHSQGGLPIPFELEVVEAALISRTTRLEAALMEVEPRVAMLLELLPNKLTADALEELRLSKQALVELGSKAGALRQMLLELLEDSDRIRRMTAMGRLCRSHRGSGLLECEGDFDEQEAEEEEEEVETLLEYYLQRCDSCHGQAEKLLDSAKEMEDSIAVNLSSRRLEVNRLELLLAIGTFACAVGAMVAGIFGMNLTSYLETQKHAFWITTGGIIFGGFALFFVLFFYLRKRKIL